MPLKTERLLPLLFFMFISYFVLKTVLVSLLPVNSAMTSYFTEERLDSNTIKYKCDITYRDLLDGLSAETDILGDIFGT